jgi:hypothetical protein
MRRKEIKGKAEERCQEIDKTSMIIYDLLYFW